MDPQVLVEHLTPFLPFLLEMGKETAKSVAGKIGEEGWEKAKENAAALWKHIHPKAKDDSSLMQAAENVAKAQEALSLLPATADEKLAAEELSDYQRLFARRLKTLLDANPDLTALAQTTVEQMVRIEGEAGPIRQTARRGERIRQGAEVGPDGKVESITQEA